MDTKLPHTEGKWELSLNKFMVIVKPPTFDSIKRIADCSHINIDFKEGRANAERIVTCVNAMQGLSNEEVKGLREQNRKLKEDLQDLAERIEDAMERDEKRDM